MWGEKDTRTRWNDVGGRDGSRSRRWRFSFRSGARHGVNWNDQVYQKRRFETTSEKVSQKRKEWGFWNSNHEPTARDERVLFYSVICDCKTDRERRLKGAGDWWHALIGAWRGSFGQAILEIHKKLRARVWAVRDSDRESTRLRYGVCTYFDNFDEPLRKDI